MSIPRLLPHTTTPIQASVNFTKSPAGGDVMGTDTANFTGMHVKLSVP
jgi:hypothetical protein